VAQTKLIRQSSLNWQSKLVLLLVVPYAAAGVVLQAHWWAMQYPPVAIWTIGFSLLLALIVFKVRAATLGAAATGAVITASLMFSTVTVPYLPTRTALLPVLAVSLLAWLSTRLGRARKERLGTAENRRGRTAAQIAANLGIAALVSDSFFQSFVIDSHLVVPTAADPELIFAIGLAALAEAAADTVSSEVGQVLGGVPRMITTLRTAEPGTDGAISLAGTLAGVAAAGIVAAIGTFAFHGEGKMLVISFAGGVFGLLFDSLLGATLEQRGLLNNDAVNFISTGSAALFALGLLAVFKTH
jgi:uncharacterized protein (TIGR00297 family)